MKKDFSLALEMTMRVKTEEDILLRLGIRD